MSLLNYTCLFFLTIDPSPSYANNATLREQLQDRLYQDANSVSCERLATNLCRLSRRCPYLIGNSHVVTLAKEKINFFNSIARKNESNFSANFKILTDALEIADTVNLQYTDTIQEAMKISLEDTRRGLL